MFYTAQGEIPLPHFALQRQESQTADLYQLKELLPQDVLGTHARAQVFVPEWAFKPDHWTTTFLRGLTKVGKELAGAFLWEVGVGTGINQILLSEVIERGTWYYSDYNPDCVLLASYNLRMAGITGKYYALGGRRNLVHGEVGEEVPKVDVIFGCLPQVPTTQGIDAGNRVAHYYDPQMFPHSRRHACGLALNEALLIGAKKVLPKKGRVILNLSGRPGVGQLHQMFKECGYTSRVLYETIVPQHKDTSLHSLSVVESEVGPGPVFEFFADEEAQVPLSASSAEARRLKGESVYHKICVMEGVLR